MKVSTVQGKSSTLEASHVIPGTEVGPGSFGEHVVWGGGDLQSDCQRQDSQERRSVSRGRGDC